MQTGVSLFLVSNSGSVRAVSTQIPDGAEGLFAMGVAPSSCEANSSEILMGFIRPYEDANGASWRDLWLLRYELKATAGELSQVGQKVLLNRDVAVAAVLAWGGRWFVAGAGPSQPFLKEFDFDRPSPLADLAIETSSDDTDPGQQTLSDDTPKPAVGMVHTGAALTVTAANSLSAASNLETVYRAKFPEQTTVSPAAVTYRVGCL